MADYMRERGRAEITFCEVQSFVGGFRNVCSMCCNVCSTWKRATSRICVSSSSDCASGFPGPLALSVSFKNADIRESACNRSGKTISTACSAADAIKCAASASPRATARFCSIAFMRLSRYWRDNMEQQAGSNNTDSAQCQFKLLTAFPLCVEPWLLPHVTSPDWSHTWKQSSS